MSDYEDAPNIGLLKYEHELRQICYGLQEENKKLREVVKDFHETLKHHLSKFDVNDELIYSIIEKHEKFLKDLK